MTNTSDVTAQLRKVFDHVIDQGFNLSIYPLDHSAVMYSHDIDALIQAASHDDWNLVQVHRSRTLVGTFVVDLEAARSGGPLVSTSTRSLDYLFKD